MWQRGLEGDPDDYGEWWIMPGHGAGLHWIEFELTEDIETSDASAAASVVSGYGPGLPAASTAVTILNLATDTASVYMFEGSSGAHGLAMYKGGTTYQAWQLNCL